MVDGAGYELDLDQPLNWSPGGTIDSRTIQFDHSPWPAALVLANQLHRLQSNLGHDAPRMISTGWTRVALRAGK